IAGLPVGQGTAGGLQRKRMRRAALAAVIEQLARGQPPGGIGGGAPVGAVRIAADAADAVLPLAQRGLVGVVDFDPVEQRACATVAQPAVQLPTEGAERAVAAVA